MAHLRTRYRRAAFALRAAMPLSWVWSAHTVPGGIEFGQVHYFHHYRFRQGRALFYPHPRISLDHDLVTTVATFIRNVEKQGRFVRRAEQDPAVAFGTPAPPEEICPTSATVSAAAPKS